MNRVFTTLLLLAISYQLRAQITPSEGRVLNYRLIGFSFPQKQKVALNIIEIAAGIYNNEEDFNKNIIASFSGATNKIIGEVPAFGKEYTWRSVCINKDSSKTKSTLHRFSTKINEQADTNAARLRIIKNAKKYKDAYIFLDDTHTLYDMKGSPVWCLPVKDKTVMDLKLSPQSTITYIDNNKPFETDYNGHILWQRPADTNAQNPQVYHHEFTRLGNGHYMTLKNESGHWKLPLFKDSIAQNVNDSVRFYQTFFYETAEEYDEYGNRVWTWSSLDYIKKCDLYNRRTADGKYDFDLHENSFYFDEKDKVIYISFRAISRVIKIKYPEGNVLNSYGALYEPGMVKMDNDLFCNQHACRLSKEGYLYLFDNNTCGSPAIPKIVMMKEPTLTNDTMKKVWEYQCTIDGMHASRKENLNFPKGGNVEELPDGSMFVSMCGPYSKIFITDRNKDVLWSAVGEKYDTVAKQWMNMTLYRASIIPNREELEKLIWNAGDKL